MDITQKLINLIGLITKDNCARAEHHKENGSIDIVDIVEICDNGECIGNIGEICMTIQPLEEGAKVVVYDECIEVSGPVSGVWRFYPDCDKSVFELITEQK